MHVPRGKMEACPLSMFRTLTNVELYGYLQTSARLYLTLCEYNNILKKKMSVVNVCLRSKSAINTCICYGECCDVISPHE